MKRDRFRSKYLETFGLRNSSDLNKILQEQILNESVVSHQKLAEFALRFEVPSSHRIVVWKLLSGSWFLFKFVVLLFVQFTFNYLLFFLVLLCQNLIFFPFKVSFFSQIFHLKPKRYGILSLLSGASSLRTECLPFLERQYSEIYETLLRSIRTMRKVEIVVSKDSTFCAYQ